MHELDDRTKIVINYLVFDKKTEEKKKQDKKKTWNKITRNEISYGGEKNQ